jgi:hypothetical protein
MRFRAVFFVLGALLCFLGISMLGERAAHAASTNDAPLCDERAASAYAAEPAPQPVDGGDIERTPDAGCKAVLASGEPVSSKDDLSRTPEVPHDSNWLIPSAPMLVYPAVSADAERAIVVDRPSDEHRLNDNPPPKPIPWRG